MDSPITIEVEIPTDDGDIPVEIEETELELEVLIEEPKVEIRAVREDYIDPYLFTGLADDKDSLEDVAVWKIIMTEVEINGDTLTPVIFTNKKWTDRATLIP